GQRFEGDPGGVEGVAIRELVLVICEVDDRWLDAAAVGKDYVGEAGGAIESILIFFSCYFFIFFLN
ncbi:Unknown protein, partial [Striga hermonthica]